MSDEGSLVRAMAGAGAVRIVAVEARGPAQETARRHGLGPGAARIAADAVVAAALMSAHIKGSERMTLQLQGSAPRVAVFVEVDAEGRIRGRVTPPDATPRPDGGLSGILVAVKSDAEREMYRGATEVEGTLEDALREHLGSSAQLDAVLRIRSEVDPSGEIRAARGVLVEKLPGHGRDRAMEVRAIGILEVLRDRSAQEILDAVHDGRLLDEPIEVLERRPLVWACRCSRDKVERTLVALGTADLVQMAEEDRGAEVRCHFCNEVYRFTEAELRALIPPGGAAPAEA